MKHTFNHLRTYITPAQSGFLPNHSTVTQLLDLYHNIQEELDERKEMYVLFCDISKAFDRTSHKGIITKLFQMGIRGPFLNLFKNYLSDRKQRVTIGGEFSKWLPIKAGIPQGSVLGPLLFLVFINDIGCNINFGLRLFADDATHSHASINLIMDEPEIQTDINGLIFWGNKWEVTYSEIKTEHMIMSRRANRTHLNINMNNAIIREVNTHAHLGLILNNKATWHDHVSNLITKADKKLGILKKLKYKCDRNTLLTIYTSYVRSVLEYSDVVWDNIPQDLVNRLETIQIDALRCITGITISASRDNLYKETGLLPLAKRRKLHRLVMFYKIVQGLAPSYLQRLLPNTAANRHQHNIRENRLTPFLCHTESFQRSFFPQTTRDWNSLPPEIKIKPTVSAFKLALSRQPEFNTVTPPPWFNSGSRPENVYITRMRNSCSALSFDLFTNHVIDSPVCRNCNLNVNETSAHYLLDCPKFEEERKVLRIDVATITNSPVFLNPGNLLCGGSLLSSEQNSSIFVALSKFIKDSRRF